MIRLLAIALTTGLACAACKVERTPPEFFDQRSPAVSERDAALDELRARLALLSLALGRGDSDGALATLTPAPGAFVIGVGAGIERSGRPAVAEALTQVMALGPVQMDVRDMQLAVAPRGNVAWFAALLTTLDHAPGDTAGAVLRVSGVYVRHEGSWQLAQAHLSYPSSSDGVNGAAPPRAVRSGSPPAQ